MKIFYYAVILALLLGFSIREMKRASKKTIEALELIENRQKQILERDSDVSMRVMTVIDSLTKQITELEKEISGISLKLKTIKNENVKNLNTYSSIVLERPDF